MAKKRLTKRHDYVAEFNRCVGDNIIRVIRHLERRGYEVERIPQLTSLKIRRPKGASFKEFMDDLSGLLQPRRGSLLLASSSGRSWSCSMRGNRQGDFVRLY
ncbi:MAG: hypothetical protein V4475_11560 [Pseudomonadota bacterium]